MTYFDDFSPSSALMQYNTITVNTNIYLVPKIVLSFLFHILIITFSFSLSTDRDLNIDPVMQKYMQMVQQSKQQTGSKVKKPDEDNDDDDEIEQKVKRMCIKSTFLFKIEYKYWVSKQKVGCNLCSINWN